MRAKPIRVRRGTRRAWEVVGEFSYDDQGQLIAAKNIAGDITRYTYTRRGEVASVTDPEGDTTRFEYDHLGRRAAATRNGQTERMEYDAQGRVRARVAIDGTRTEFVFDKQGQIEALKQNGEISIQYERNEFGQVVGEKDSLGRVRKVERDVRGNLLAEHSPNGSVTRYEYDKFNRRIAQIDGNGNKIAFEYDPMGRLIKQTNPLGDTLAWKYDDKGRLIERTNGEQTILRTHDKDGRLTLLDYGSGQRIEYTYDKEGRMLRATTPETAFEYSYDKLGRVASTQVRHGGEESLIRYHHNARGQRTGLVLFRLIPEVPSTSGRAGREAYWQVLHQTHYAYDAAGRLVVIMTNGLPSVTYRYDNASRVIQKIYGGDKPETAAVTATIGYDSRGRLAQIEFVGASLGEPKRLSYEWDSANQLTRRTWNGETQRYEYDSGGQLLKVLDDQTGQVLESYRYDPAGNMLEKKVGERRAGMAYNAANQLVKVYDLPSVADDDAENRAAGAVMAQGKPALEVGAYSYDKAGRMLGIEGQGTNAYGWLDKVTELTQPDGSKVTFTYWPDGQLAANQAIAAASIKNTPQGANPQPNIAHDTFLWDGLALLKRNDTIYIIEPHPSGGIPVASHPVGRPDQITWHLNDLLGTTLATVKQGAPRFAKLTAFGQPLKLASDISVTTPVPPDVPPLPSAPQTHTMQKTMITN